MDIQEFIVFNLTKEIELKCQDLNLDVLCDLSPEQFESTWSRLSKSGSNSIHRCINEIRDKDNRLVAKPSNLMKGLGELGFPEHLALYSQLTSEFNSFSHLKDKGQLDSFTKIVTQWRNTKRAHSKRLENLPSDDFQEFLKAVKPICFELGLHQEYEREVHRYHSKDDLIHVKNNLPSPEYEQDGGQFFGRIDEKKKIKKSIGTNSVTCISGRGGLGKTALAQSVCSQIVSSTNPEFDFVVWFSNKTDVLDFRGIQSLNDIDSSYLSLLKAILHAIDSEFECESEDEIVDALRSFILPKDRMLVILDNFETMEETCSAEDYQKFCSLLDGIVELPFEVDVRWLVTSRNAIPYGKSITLEKLNDTDAANLLLQTVRNTDNFPPKYRKSLENKKTRLDWIHKLHNYPLYIKVVCGWLGQGKSYEQCFGSHKNLTELEEFCYRNTTEYINGPSKLILRSIILLLDRCERGSQSEVGRSECREVLKLDIEDFDDAMTQLLAVCVVNQNENGSVVIAPGMRSYLSRNLVCEEVEKKNIEVAFNRLKKMREVRMEFLTCHSNKNSRSETIKAKKLRNAIKQARPEHIEGVLHDVKESKYRCQLETLVHAKQGNLTNDNTSRFWTNSIREIENGFGYWTLVYDLWLSTYSFMDLEQRIEIAGFLKTSFPDVIAPKTNLALQVILNETRGGCQDSSKICDSLQVFIDVKESEFNKTFNYRAWHKQCQLALGYLDYNDLPFDEDMSHFAERLLELMLTKATLDESDTQWTLKHHKCLSRYVPEIWEKWLVKGSLFFHDNFDFDQADKWSRVMTSATAD